MFYLCLKLCVEKTNIVIKDLPIKIDNLKLIYFKTHMHQTVKYKIILELVDSGVKHGGQYSKLATCGTSTKM